MSQEQTCSQKVIGPRDLGLQMVDLLGIPQHQLPGKLFGLVLGPRECSRWSHAWIGVPLSPDRGTSPTETRGHQEHHRAVLRKEQDHM